MARYDVFKNPDGEGWLLDVQTDLLDGLSTRVVAPLLPLAAAPTPAKRLNPIFDVSGEKVVMTTQFLAAVPGTLLKKPHSNLAPYHDDIIAALDMVFHGF